MFNCVKLIKKPFIKLFFFPICCQSLAFFFFAVFVQNLKVAVPESISADLGECILLYCLTKL